tara:strand:- start:38787 stop:39413 length:627 start_codon:yes stop_codon:yes gene_type:complete
MSERKIAECINIRVNVGNFQHIEFTKYAEEKIEYSNDAERVEKEESLRDDLVKSIISSLETLPAKLKKGQAEAVEVQEAIATAIPEWLAENPIPNIANSAEKKFIQSTAEQKSKKDVASKVDGLEVKAVKTEPVESTVESTEGKDDVEDLFEDNADSGAGVEVPAEKDTDEENKENTEEPKKDKKTDKVDDGFEEVFDAEDDDLFSIM